MAQFQYNCKNCGAKAFNVHAPTKERDQRTLGTWRCSCSRGKVPVTRTKVGK